MPNAAPQESTQEMASPNDVYEFFSPFAHIPGKYEWARIHSPTHGSFDCFIVVETTTDRPVTVYVNSENGERFMKDRYPESRAIRVGKRHLRLQASPDGRVVRGELRAESGPIRHVRMRLAAPETAVPRAEAYGGRTFPVWGSRWTCSGVDLNLDGSCRGLIRFEDGRRTALDGLPCLVALGSYARISELSTAARQ